MITTIDILGKSHIIKPCQFEDVPMHFEKIKDVIPEEEADSFITRMTDCIIAETAFTLSDDSCFLYYKNYKPTMAEGVALYGENAPVKVLALFSGIFIQIDPVTFKLDFALHPGTFAKDYKSILTTTSLKLSNHSNHPLVIRIDELKKKIDKIYKRKGFQWVV